jgi:hypothetical protein
VSPVELTDRRRGGGGGGQGAESYDGKKACSSINNSILYVYADYTIRDRCVLLKVNRDVMKTSKFVFFGF